MCLAKGHGLSHVGIWPSGYSCGLLCLAVCLLSGCHKTTSSDDLQLILAKHGDFAFPVADGGLIDAQSIGKSGIAAEVMDGLICVHGV